MKKCCLLLLICTACAKQVPLTGGLKDIDPPVILTTVPANGSLNFQGQEIVLEFDEYIKEDNLRSQLLITPRTSSTYKTKVNRNKITLSFEEPFDSATTYTLNFREGIKDITESNVPDNLTFVFSTGDFLDSVSVSGKVRSLMTLEPQEDITISMYQVDDSLTIFSGPPLYSTKTLKDGSFSLRNVKYGTYLVYALSDANRNLKLESQDESYAFLPSSLLLSDSTSGLEFNLQTLDTRPIVLQNSRPVHSNFDLKFNKYLVDYQLLDSTILLKSNLVESHKTLRIYKNDQVKDSLALRFQVRDSLSQKLDTTVYIKFQESTREPEKFTANLLLPSGGVNRRFTSMLVLTKPVDRINYDSIYFRFDSVTQIPLSPDAITLNYSGDLIELRVDMDSIFNQDTTLLRWENNFEFIIAKTGFISVEEDTLNQIVRELIIKKPEEHGVLAGSIKTSYPSYTLQLIDKNFKVIETQKSSESAQYAFRNVVPGDYSIRLLIDADNNGEWDPGNINESRLPEPVRLFFHPNVGSNTITIRANWEQNDVDLDF
ncbi:MAG: Ig-like domain-containing protein [Cyclobacteriaceae bacterium]|nr:Ig-like domain-containing protein [Cyclobacteriaceae bacterium]